MTTIGVVIIVILVGLTIVAGIIIYCCCFNKKPVDGANPNKAEDPLPKVDDPED